ncbi:MAG TPA: YIP1 family protein [Acidimicrobiia bacterium]|jgi:hypothetical protein
MQEVWPRLFQAVRLRRDAFVWMDFNDRATGDALLLVVGTRVLLFLGFSGVGAIGVSLGWLEALFGTILGGVIFWLWFSGLSHVIGRYVFEGGTTFAATMRISGFAYPTQLVQIAAAYFVSSLLAFLVAAVWFLAICAAGIHHTADLPNDKAWLTVIGAVAGYLAITAIFRGLFAGLPL